MRRNKGQVQSQAFIYILTIIIIGLLFLFGFKWINELIEMKEDIDMAKFRLDLVEAFDNIRPDYMSTYKFSSAVPEGILKICLVSRWQGWTLGNYPGLCDESHPDFDRLMCNAWKAESQNVLVKPMDALEGEISVGDIAFKDGLPYKCYNTENHRIEIKLTGLGDSVEIS